MIVLPRKEAKERILRVMQERVDRSRYIVASPPEERNPHLDLAEYLPRRRPRDDRA